MKSSKSMLIKTGYPNFLHRCDFLCFINYWCVWESTFLSFTKSDKKIMTQKVFGYLILISIPFYFSVFSLVLVSIKKIYQTLKTVSDHLSKHLGACNKHYAARRTFFLSGVIKYRQTRSFVFDQEIKIIIGRRPCMGNVLSQIIFS